MQENPSTLLRFEDATDEQVPRLNYSVPLPGALEGRYFLETQFGALPWRPAAFLAERVVPDVVAFGDQIAAGAAAEPPPLHRLALVSPALRSPSAQPERAASAAVAAGPTTRAGGAPSAPATGPTGLTADGGLVQRGGNWQVEVAGLQVPFAQILAEAREGRKLIVYRSLGGAPRFGFVAEAPVGAPARPRFVIVEHYRLSSFFGDYGAGRTASVFSLMPGEETKLHVRSWRRTEQKMKEASSVFDSFTQEAADDFEQTLESEVTDQAGYEKSKEWNVKFNASSHFGFGKIASADVGIEVGGAGSTHSSREQMSKSVNKSTQHHSSKASGKRETTVSTDIEVSESQEFETITERVVKNTNLSRTLNVVARELNQEFTTYLALVDVTVAFANDRGVFDEFAIHELDDMLLKYLPPPPEPGSIIFDTPPFNRVRNALLQQIRTVFDFQGTQHDLLETVQVPNGRPYLRVRRSHHPDQPNPFYEPGFVPVEGIVLSVSRNTLRTDALIIDSLLGHGVALDNYALGLQQEALRKQQLENRKVEVALGLIESLDEGRLEAYRSLFGAVDNALLQQVALQE
jgi:hypothetical protein